MNVHQLKFIFIAFVFVSCKSTIKKTARIQDKSIEKIDTIRFLAIEDSLFIRKNAKDTTGYAIDFLNRFSEELSIPYKLILCQDQCDVKRRFELGFGNLYLSTTLHDSIEINDGELLSEDLIVRNLPSSPTLIFDICNESFSVVSNLPKFIKKSVSKRLTSNHDKRLLVRSKFKVNTKDSIFLKKLDGYIKNVEFRADIAFLKNFYFGLSLPINMKKYLIPSFKDGQLSPYDEIFKMAAKEYGWDWKLLAAISFKESRFNPTAVGAGGAFGLMQFMPSIGKKYGVSLTSTPQQQIKAGMKLLSKAYASWVTIPSQEQRIKFTLASYNAGKAHIDDAQRLAEKHGLNPLVWDGNVQLMVNNLSLAKYYTDDVVKFGAYHGQADRYANLVYQIYLSWKVQ